MNLSNADAVDRRRNTVQSISIMAPKTSAVARENTAHASLELQWITLVLVYGVFYTVVQGRTSPLTHRVCSSYTVVFPRPAHKQTQAQSCNEAAAQ
ncbi:hypothetical protein CFAM422_003020 [Trichoderma lentiforme]|uniref:Uncharacterized protein n=1 Tax=Trichoderma lentiforme TaxID=1567552 RepID=A0A9P4XLK4_9HYPO|nr:hypothetical protein CFAM422_003020 [Trichoderma lentiforme]